MRRLQEMIGLPVMRGGRRFGTVSSLCLSADVRRVTGVNVRRTLRGDVFVPGEKVRTLDADRIEIAPDGESAARADAKPGAVCDRSGVRVGLVTDAAIDEQTLEVTALEVTFGPMDDLLGGRRWVRRFTACAHGIVIPVPEWERGKPS